MEANQSRRERFMAKAETYLHKYKSSQSDSTNATPTAPATIGGNDSNVTTDRHLEFFKKVQEYLHKKDKKDDNDNNDNHKKDKKDGDGDDKDDHEEHLKLVYKMLKKIKKHKGGGHGKGSSNEEEELEEEESEEEEEECDEEDGGWFTELVEGIQQLLEE